MFKLFWICWRIFDLLLLAAKTQKSQIWGGRGLGGAGVKILTFSHLVDLLIVCITFVCEPVVFADHAQGIQTAHARFSSIGFLLD